MPELPEVEVLVRHLRPLIAGRRIRKVRIFRKKVLGITTEQDLVRVMEGANFLTVNRRGKYLVFSCAAKQRPFDLVGHLGMTGRMFLIKSGQSLPRHTAVVLDLGMEQFVFQDTRVFGRFTLDTSAIQFLGPEPLDGEWTAGELWTALKASRQPVKTRLLDQRLVAGIGNIYASEALFRSGISPGLASNRVSRARAAQLWKGIRDVLSEAIQVGSTIPLNFSGNGERNGLFYYGALAGNETNHERLQVYDRAGEPCMICSTAIKRVVHAARSSFFCPKCQRR